MLLTTLPTDLIHDIFLMLDDRKTLAAFVSTNRILHEVFKAHPNAILGQVVCNQIGMDIQVLPYAWATINSLRREDTDDLMEKDILSQSQLVISLSRWTFASLEEHHTVVQSLAKQYSIRFKEGRILRDTLTPEESRRFHVACYLFLHYQAIWRTLQEYAANVSEEEDAREHPEQDAKTTQVCDGFLAGLSTDELLWMQELIDFLLQDVDNTLDLKNDPTYFDQSGFTDRNAANLSTDSWRHFLLSTSLEHFGSWEDVFEDTEYAPTHLQRKELWFTDAVSRVLHERGFGTQLKNEKLLKSKGILVPACQKCGERKHWIFNKTNLEEYTEHWDLRFSGGMKYNPIERERAHRRIFSSDPPLPELEQKERLAVIKEIMVHAEARASLILENGETSGNGLVLSDDEDDEVEVQTTAAAEYKWSPDDVLCNSCFSTIFSELYYAWWLEERQTDRVEAHIFLEEPCWWGDECRTQIRFDHASRRDHCFPRTKGVIS